jgi:hypothetical protein
VSNQLRHFTEKPYLGLKLHCFPLDCRRRVKVTGVCVRPLRSSDEAPLLVPRRCRLALLTLLALRARSERVNLHLLCDEACRHAASATTTIRQGKLGSPSDLRRAQTRVLVASSSSGTRSEQHKQPKDNQTHTTMKPKLLYGLRFSVLRNLDASPAKNVSRPQTTRIDLVQT